jgi:hypothetical protein
LQQVVRTAGLRTDARELETAERLTADERAGDFAIDVEVAHAKFSLRAGDVHRAA